MTCQCCKEQKARLRYVESKLMKGNEIILCTQCFNSNHEPRHNIIIASYSRQDISEYVVNELYCGERLRALEVMHKL